jgi:hypothetical protein
MLAGSKVKSWEYKKTDALKAEALRLCLAYWSSKIRDGNLPSRQDIDPLECRRFLSQCLIIEVEGEGLFRYRLFGTHIAEGNFRDLTRQLVAQETLGDAAPLFKAAFERTCTERAAIAFNGSLFWQDREHVRFEQVCLPLANAQGDIVSLFSAVEIDGYV